MKYICLAYQDESSFLAMSDAEMDAVVDHCYHWVEELKASGRYVASSALQSPRSATTVRGRRGTLSLTDGPFAETKEFLGGFTIFEAHDLNEAIQVASNFASGVQGTIEVRPLFDFDHPMPDPIDQRAAAAMQRHGLKIGQMQG